MHERNRFIDIHAITAFTDDQEYLIDLCEEDDVVASYVVKAPLPCGESVSWRAYEMTRGYAKAKAVEVMKEKHHEFYHKFLSISRLKNIGIPFLTVGDSMLIVRPISWVIKGLRAYEVVVRYIDYKGIERSWTETFRAKNKEEACEMALKKQVANHGDQLN